MVMLRVPENPRMLEDLETGYRPLKRVEFQRLASEGFFDDERVELLFGVVVAMAPTKPPHSESTDRVGDLIRERLAKRARVRVQGPFAASDISQPQPDVFVMPNGEYWDDHPDHAFLIVEVSRSSLRQDRGLKAKLYGLAHVDEYWIVNQVDSVVEVYRDAYDGEWRSKQTFARGATIQLLAFPDVSIAVDDILPPPGV